MLNYWDMYDDKARNYGVTLSDVFECDLDSSCEELCEWGAGVDFVFNHAGVNRPKDNSGFMSGFFLWGEPRRCWSLFVLPA